MSRGGRLRRVEPTTTSANGIWTLNEIADYISETKWPRGPVAPTSLTAFAGNAQLSLSWTAPATTYGTITNYLVEYTASGGSAQYILTNSTSTSYTLTGLTNGTAYTVRVAAVNFTAGDYSNAVTVTPVTLSLFNIEYLVVAGGGGAGGNIDPTLWGGGGGAGGYRTGTITSHSLLSPTSVIVGNGGSGGLDEIAANVDYGWPRQELTYAANGSNSSLGSITSNGGGAGANSYQRFTNSPLNPGSNGGSGGGGGGTSYQYIISTRGTGTAGQGNNGGDGGDYNIVGGGGGAGGAGGGGGDYALGGAGVSNSITGSAVVYSAGGSDTGNAPNYAQNQNTGHGGTTMGGQTRGSNPVKAGKKGVVILAYPSSQPALTNISAGLTYTVSTTSRSGFLVYTFTNGSGNIQFS